MLPATTQRVETHTSRKINQQIERRMEHSIKYFAEHPDEINHRLEQLDREWDIERTLEANAATLALAGLTLGSTVDKRWYALPAVVGGFLLQHALQGWCPPVPVLRRLGFRTQSEIETERYALKTLRGDLASFCPPPARSTAVEPRELLHALNPRLARERPAA